MVRKYFWNIWTTGTGAREGKREVLMSHFFLLSPFIYCLVLYYFKYTCFELFN